MQTLLPKLPAACWSSSANKMSRIDERTLRSIIDTIAKEVSSSRALNLENARRLSGQIQRKAAEMGAKAVIAIADRGGHPILIERMDDAFIASYDIAVNKAFTVVSLKMSTSDLKPLAQPGGSLYGIQFTNQGKIVIFGAVYLAIVALLPIIAGNTIEGASNLAIGGTSIIIVVGVALETVKALEAQMLMRHYKGFLD